VTVVLWLAEGADCNGDRHRPCYCLWVRLSADRVCLCQTRLQRTQDEENVEAIFGRRERRNLKNGLA